MGLQPGELHIHDGNFMHHVDTFVNGQRMSRGCVKRDYSTHPRGCHSEVKAVNIPLIARSEWPERIREMTANKSRISDVRRRAGPSGGHIPSLDQDGVGYCWNHSATMAVILKRALMGLPYVRLSAFMIGCLIKQYRDEGGWGADALDFIMKNGVPSVEFWPEKSMERRNDTLDMRANALLHRAVAVAMDLAEPAYDRNLSEDQVMTLLLTRNPVIGDFNWWSHSVVLVDVVQISEARTADLASLDFNNLADLAVYAAAFGKRGINSWTDSYGDLGEFVLSGSKAILDGGASLLDTMASAA